MNVGKTQLKLVKASTSSKSKEIQDLERLGKKGLDVALLLAQLGDIDPLARLLAACNLAIAHGNNLIRGVDGVDN